MDSSNGLNMWDALPEECKSMILTRLSKKEAARIARVSKEFAQAVKNVRSAVHILSLPPDLSPAALQGLVGAHPNLKSLSFRRCSAKLKKFGPILEAAAGGKPSESQHQRSLEAVDFKSCTYLNDSDVIALCVLHSRLDDINLANCQSISDTALTALSRYEKFHDPTLVQTLTLLAEAPEEDEQQTVPEVKSHQNLQISSDCTWPKLSQQPKALSTTRDKNIETGNKKILEGGPGAAQESESPQLVQGETKVVPKSSGETMPVNIRQSSNIENHSFIPVEGNVVPKTYAQAASKALMSVNSSVRQNIDIPGHGEAIHCNLVSDTLPYLDWRSIEIPSLKFDSLTSDRSETNHPGVRTDFDIPSSSNGTVAAGKERNTQELYQPLPDEVPHHKETWCDRYRRYILDEIDNSADHIPVLMDALQLSCGQRKDRQGSSSPSRMQVDSAGSKDPVMMQVDASGTKYCSYNVEVSGDKKLATRRKLLVPSLPASSSDEFNTLAKNFKASKAVRVASATQITDQRLQLPGRSPTDKCVEAFSTTESDVGVFMISDDSSSDSRAELTNAAPAPKLKLLESRYAENPAQLSQPPTPPAAAIDALQAGNLVVKSGKHKDAALALLEYIVETPASSEKSSNTLDNCLEVEPRSFRGLKSLSVASCGDITDKGVQALLKGPSRASLLSLDVSRCPGVTSTGLRLPPKSALEVLTAAQMPNITRLTLQLSREGALQHLSLAACPKLEDLCLVAPHVQSLNVSNCKKLVRLQLKCPALTSVNLSLCDNLEAFGRFNCSALQNVNAIGCRLLTPAALSAILESASGLQELRCGGCDRLERVDIPQASLLHLEVSGCSSLRRLYAHSRALRVVEACGCKSLVEVFLYSPLLRRMLFSNCALLQTLVIPLDAIKESVDSAVKNRGKKGNLPQEGCGDLHQWM